MWRIESNTPMRNTHTHTYNDDQNPATCVVDVINILLLYFSLLLSSVGYRRFSLEMYCNVWNSKYTHCVRDRTIVKWQVCDKTRAILAMTVHSRVFRYNNSTNGSIKAAEVWNVSTGFQIYLSIFDWTCLCHHNRIRLRLVTLRHKRPIFSWFFIFIYHCSLVHRSRRMWDAVACGFGSIRFLSRIQFHSIVVNAVRTHNWNQNRNSMPKTLSSFPWSPINFSIHFASCTVHMGYKT